MTYKIRPLNFDVSGEVSCAASFSMLTILETLPEARLEPDIVPNLSIEAMSEMYARGATNENHLYLVVEDADGALVGHAIALLREDDDGVTHGYSYTRYVLPKHRRQGLGKRLLDQALAWWREREAVYVLAHTHPSNTALLGLFTRAGFVEVERKTTRWESVTLRLEM